MRARLAWWAAALFFAGCGAEQHLTVTWSEPSSDAHTNGSILLRAVVSGGRADSVQFLDNGQPLVSLDLPYEYLWDTRSVPEGEHLLTARATRGNITDDSRQVAVFVDRTPPAVAGRSPASSARDGSPVEPAVLSFTEAIDPASVSGVQAAFLSGGVSIPATVLKGAEPGDVTFTPTVSLPEVAAVQLQLTGSVRDLAGNPRALDVESWGYSTLGFAPIVSYATNGGLAEVHSSGTDVFLGTRAGITRLSASGADPQVPVQYVGLAVLQGGTLVRSRGEAGPTIVVEELSVPVLTPGSSTAPMAMDVSENFFLVDRASSPVLFLERNDYPNFRFRFARWNGTGWLEIAPLQPGNVIRSLEVGGKLLVRAQLAQDGGPIRDGLYQEAGDGGWAWLPGPMAPPAEVEAISTDRQGRLVTGSLCFPDGGAAAAVHRWNGSVWESIGSPTPITEPIQEVLIDARGEPWVAIVVPDPYRLEIRHLSGGTWRVVGGPRVSVGYSPTLVATDDGNVWRAWTEADGGITVGQFGMR
jgi:hypothetical protein